MNTNIIAMITFLVPVLCFSADKGIYGIDDRKDVYESNQMQQKLAKSVAAVVAMDISPDEQGYVDLGLRSFKEDYSICDGEKFSDQPILGYCTASLISEDTMLTAGHCFPSKDSCKEKKFVFDYVMGPDGKWPGKFNLSQIYSCSEIIAQSNEEIVDYAIIKLDRPVKDRVPLAVNRGEKLKKGDFVFVIGSPMGLPLKVADNAKVRDVKDQYYMVDSDTFGGNSGSPVFNAMTGRIEGILTGGGQDLELKNDGACVGSFIQSQDEGTGEMVFRAQDFFN
ncbi:MAG: hypothetical protein Fur0012_14410 [Elusimicrobiota bacterium]